MAKGGMAAHGFRLSNAAGASHLTSDARDPARRPGKGAENQKNKKGEMMRCFQCNSRFHLILARPYITAQQRTFFAELLDCTSTWLRNAMTLTEDVNLIDISNNELEDLAGNMMSHLSFDEPVVIATKIDSSTHCSCQ